MVITATEQDPRWQQIINKDSHADGQFVYAVKTTGIYCRPSCPARLAKPANVLFYDSIAAAEQAGFRPCKRCHPQRSSVIETQISTINQLCRFIENHDTIPTLNELAAQAGLSRYYLHHLFKKITGLTPKAYALAYQKQKLHTALANSTSVTEAIYESGYNSSSRFYEKAKKILGMTPTNYRAGGANTIIYFAVAQCSLGAILVAQSQLGICAISMADDPSELVQNLQKRFPAAQLVGADQQFEQVVAQVIGFIESPQTSLNLPLDIQGTSFQQKVWQALQAIPIGQTATYSEIAQRIGLPKAVRAVASACAANNIAVAIPCHRVIRSDGQLSGYRWGVERKRALLDRETNK